MQKFETPLMGGLLLSLAVFLFTDAIAVFVVMIACAAGVVAVTLTRVVRT